MSAAAGTPGSLSRRPGTSGLIPLRNYRVSHQKVYIDVDLQNKTIKGQTELTINSYDAILKHIQLDCRQISVTNVLVNQRRAQFYHHDLLKEEFKTCMNPDENTVFNDVEQHHLYKGKMKRIYSGESSEELTVFIPESLRLQQQEPMNSQNTPNGYRDSPGSHRATHTHPEVAYKALIVTIEYSLRNPQVGVRFVGGEHSSLEKSQWHAYTTNSTIGVSTSSWVPCIDSLWEKPTWEISLSVPKTVKQIGLSKMVSADILMGDADDEDDTDESQDIVVVGADFSTQHEAVHPMDLAKKLVSYEVPAPTSAHHIGWAVGPFVHTPLINFEEENQPDVQEKDITAVPSAVFCLPSQLNDAVNSTIFLYKAIDFYSREFGSYPYTGYGMVFVSDMDVDFNGFGGLSVLSTKLLYPPTAIDPIFDTTYTLSVALAEQWSGIYLVPKSYNDVWTTIGISHFMTLQFIRRLMGLNEYKYRVKKQADKICDEDVGKPPLSNLFFRFPISISDFGFIKLKAPVVMFILDRRMTKTDKSFGLTRVIPKIFVQAMSGDLPNGCLSTHHFQHVCEKVGHNRLESFFRQWVHGSGVPIFRVSQRFNKKRMFIEMGIRQVQAQETEKEHPNGESFIKEATCELEGAAESSHPILFTGPMTIRIHEADGTPYEHIVDLKEGFTKLDIQYNTKYKRLKRSQKQLKSEKEAKENADEDETVLLHCLGDILQTPKEIKDWELTDWTKEEEDKMTNEAFEWIRIDADFEWICRIHLNQPDYMYASQLQQDRDVEAQVESIHYFAHANASPLYSSILLRTLMDSRYYYGVRIEAAMGMAKFAKDQANWIGYTHLLKSFSHLYCFNKTLIPLPNDFSDFPSYFIKKAILSSLASICDSKGSCPLEIRKFLLDVLKLNQNLNNPYTDTYYVAHLINAVVTSILSNPLHDNPDRIDQQDREFLNNAIEEITRYQKMDEWKPSDAGLVGNTVMKNKLRLSRRGLFKFTPEELLTRTKSTYPDTIRILAFEGLFHMGALKNKSILDYFFLTTVFEKSMSLKQGLIEMFLKCIGTAVVEGCAIDLDEDELNREIEVEVDPESEDNGLILVEEAGTNEAVFETRRDAAARATLTGSIELLRRDYSEYEPLKRLLWSAVKHPLLSLLQKRDLYDLLFVMVPAYDTLPVTFDTPREKKIAAVNLGSGKVVLKREGLIKISFAKLSTAAAAPTKTHGHQRSKSVTKPVIKLSAPKLASHYKSVVKRSDAGPLRFVKINTKTKNIVVSSDPLKLSKKVTLKLSKEKLRETELRQMKNESLKLSDVAASKPKVVIRRPVIKPLSVPEPPVDIIVSSPEPPKPKLKLKFKGFK